jgi:hypothetical protein
MNGNSEISDPPEPPTGSVLHFLRQPVKAIPPYGGGCVLASGSENLEITDFLTEGTLTENLEHRRHWQKTRTNNVIERLVRKATPCCKH